MKIKLYIVYIKIISTTTVILIITYIISLPIDSILNIRQSIQSNSPIKKKSINISK